MNVTVPQSNLTDVSGEFGYPVTVACDPGYITNTTNTTHFTIHCLEIPDNALTYTTTDHTTTYSPTVYTTTGITTESVQILPIFEFGYWRGLQRCVGRMINLDVFLSKSIFIIVWYVCQFQYSGLGSVYILKIIKAIV